MRVDKVATVCVATLLPLGAQTQEANNVQQTLSFQITFADFEEDSGEENGQQIFAPFQYTYSTEQLDLGVRTAFIDSSRDTSFAGGSGSVQTLTDTVVSGAYRAFSGNPEWLNGRRSTLAFNFDVNVPTGQEQLTGDEKNALFDNFIVDQDRFGEGLNVGLGVSSTFELSQQTLFGLGLAFVYRGDYNPDGDAPDQELQPGNQIVGSLQFLHTAPTYQINAGYRVIYEENTEVNDVAVFDRATSHELFAVGAYRLNESWSVRGSALIDVRGADSFFNPLTGQLERSTLDDTGDTYYLSLGVMHDLSPRNRLTFAKPSSSLVSPWCRPSPPSPPGA